ncbi:MAG: hypothetical protein V3V44_02530 [Anaerolineales bacterium]
MITRYSPLLFGLILGIALGLFYGWVISPIEIVESTPDTLREDYRADLILMIAESYENEEDLDLVLHRFELLELEPPTAVLQAALEYAQNHDYKILDLQRLSTLLTDLETSDESP